MARQKKDDMPSLDGYDPDDVARIEEARQHPARAQADATEVLGGVPISWLAAVFHMDPRRVKRMLAHVPPVRVTGHGPLYDVGVAAQYLVPPKADFERFLLRAKPADLPVALQQQFWSAMQKRQKFEEQAGQLWRTEAVLDVFANVASAIRNAVMLWVDNIDRGVGLDKKQRQALRDQADALLQRLHEILVEQPRTKAPHPPTTAEIPAMIGAAEEEHALDGEDMELL